MADVHEVQEANDKFLYTVSQKMLLGIRL